jgi:hypothetical protein
MRPEEWLLIERPEDEAEPTKYFLTTASSTATLEQMVFVTKMHWRIERDYQGLKQDFGLSHYEGRNWRGFHHHATLSIAAYGFLQSFNCMNQPGVDCIGLALSTCYASRKCIMRWSCSTSHLAHLNPNCSSKLLVNLQRFRHPTGESLLIHTSVSETSSPHRSYNVKRIAVSQETSLAAETNTLENFRINFFKFNLP